MGLKILSIKSNKHNLMVVHWLRFLRKKRGIGEQPIPLFFFLKKESKALRRGIGKQPICTLTYLSMKCYVQDTPSAVSTVN